MMGEKHHVMYAYPAGNVTLTNWLMATYIMRHSPEYQDGDTKTEHSGQKRPTLKQLEHDFDFSQVKIWYFYF